MWALTQSPNQENSFISYVEENSIGEIYVENCFNVEDAIQFQTREDALDFKNYWGLRAWVLEI